MRFCKLHVKGETAERAAVVARWPINFILSATLMFAGCASVVVTEGAGGEGGAGTAGAGGEGGAGTAGAGGEGGAGTAGAGGEGGAGTAGAGGVNVGGPLSIELFSESRPYVEFDPDQTDYDVSVSYLLTELTLRVEPIDFVETVSFGEESVALDSTGQASLALSVGDATLRVSATDGIVYNIAIRRAMAAQLAEQVYLKTPERNAGGRFGGSIAVSGDTVAVGEAPEPGGGQVVVFRLDETGWRREAVLRGAETESLDFFGSDVALEGDTLVVGAPFEDSKAAEVNGDQQDNSVPESGAAYVFTRTASTWTQEAYLKSSNPEELGLFGGAVALSGNRAVVGANGEAIGGTAHVFSRDGSTWAPEDLLTASNAGSGDSFGGSLAIDGDTIAVGAASEDGEGDALQGSGAVYIFVRDGAEWSEQPVLRASNPDEFDSFGGPVTLEGDTLVVSATGEASNARGFAVDQTNNDAPYSGAVYIFARNGMTWDQRGYLKSSNSDEDDEFGGSLALDGGFLVVGATEESSSSRVINEGEADNSADSTGAAYLFRREGTTWIQELYLKASNADPGDGFGLLGLDGEILVVGAQFEDSSATNINGNKDDNSQNVAGAAYIFE